MCTTRFSIIITFYNQKGFIKDAVDSAIAQRRGLAEVVVVDDGSTDGGREVLAAYGNAIRLACLETNRGSGAARNCGAALATGEYLVFLDGDDAFAPWALDVYDRVVETKHPQLILGSMGWFRGGLPVPRAEDVPHEMRLVEYRDYLSKDRPFPNSASALVVDRLCFDRAHGWSTDIWPMNDQDFTLRLGDCGRTVQVLAPFTTYHRSHAHNTVKGIRPYIPAISKIIKNERAGGYPGGERRGRERRAVIGGPLLHWSKRAVKAGLYREAFTLLARGWPTIFAAAARRGGAILRGRQPFESIPMP